MFGAIYAKDEKVGPPYLYPIKTLVSMLVQTVKPVLLHDSDIRNCFPDDNY